MRRLPRSAWATALGVVLLATPVTVSVVAQGTPPTRPNIVFFLVDDMGWQETSVPFHAEPTALNRRYRTPNMEQLAATGMMFRQAYASAVCSPSRVSAISGMNVARHGVTNWTLRRNVSPDATPRDVRPPAWNVNGITVRAGIEGTAQVTPLPALLHAAGYRTIHVGKAHVGAQGTPGEDPRHLGFDVNIARHAAGGPGSYWAEKRFSAAWRTSPPDTIWDVPGLETYHGTNIDLTDALTREAILAVEGAVADRTPFYLYLSHYAVHAPWEGDHFPTFMEMAGARGRPRQVVDGQSLVPLLRGVDDGARRRARPLVWHFPHVYGGQEPFSAIRVGDWKLIYHHADRRRELFDLSTDLSETTDLAARQPDRLASLSDQLAALLASRGALMPTDARTGRPVELPGSRAPRDHEPSR